MEFDLLGQKLLEVTQDQQLEKMQMVLLTHHVFYYQLIMDIK
jgi:hypothetical protein